MTLSSPRATGCTASSAEHGQDGRNRIQAWGAHATSSLLVRRSGADGSSLRRPNPAMGHNSRMLRLPGMVHILPGMDEHAASVVARLIPDAARRPIRRKEGSAKPMPTVRVTEGTRTPDLRDHNPNRPRTSSLLLELYGQGPAVLLNRK